MGKEDPASKTREIQDFVLKLLAEQQPKLTTDFHVAVAEAFEKMVPAKTNKILQELFETGRIVKKKTKEQDQLSGKYTDVWFLPGAHDTLTFIEEITLEIDTKLQSTAVAIGTRLQMILAEHIRKSGVDKEIVSIVRPTHQDLVLMIRRCLDDAVRKNEWPWDL